MRLLWTPIALVLLTPLSAAPARAATPSPDRDQHANGSEANVSAGSAQGGGAVKVDVADILGRALPAKVELRTGVGAAPVVIMAPEGHAEQECPPGKYTAYIYVYEWGVPLLAEVKPVTVDAHAEALVAFNLDLGLTKEMPLRAFDKDGDLAIDRAELHAETNPEDPSDVPGLKPLPFEDRILDEKPGWYRGELHAHSKYGEGTETVGQLIKRAEKAKLDFLAVTDRNTMAACSDPEFRSNTLALIPAMKWGAEEMGVALIYGPRTFPEPASSVAEAQAIAERVQAQGGIYVVAHPCFPNAPWQWGLSYVNGIEVWCRDWNAVPPLALDALHESLRGKEASQDGKWIYSIARAAATPRLSANGQAALFWDYELDRRLKASPIAGSSSSSPKVPLGAPITYVFAANKSLGAILDGLRRGRTLVSSGADGPFLHFSADVAVEKNVAIGGIIPLGVEAQFTVGVKRAKGKKLQILRNGYPMVTKIIESDDEVHRFKETAQMYSVYRVRVIDTVPEKGFGDANVLAMSSPIYAQDVMLVDAQTGPEKYWLSLQNESMTPLYTSGVKTQNGRTQVHVDKDQYQRPPEYIGAPPGNPTQAREIKPEWHY